jgi:putative endonuclease
MGVAGARGRAGEALAAAYLELRGCVIRARNVRLAGVEVDMLVEEGRTLVLVEVKTRTRGDYGGAALAARRGHDRGRASETHRSGGDRDARQRRGGHALPQRAERHVNEGER